MGNTRTFIKPCPQAYNMKIRGRLYTGSQKPCQVLVPTRCVLPARAIGPRFPFAESILDDGVIQPYVHDCVVNVEEGELTHRFRIYYKMHSRLGNKQLFPGSNCRMRGSLFVMRMAAIEPSSVVNMRGRDSVLADFLVKRFALTILRGGKKAHPSQLTFCKPLGTRRLISRRI